MRMPRCVPAGVVTLFVAGFLSGCGSMPMLEEPECTASRGVVKELYSNHFGNDMAFSSATFEPKKRFLTPGFAASLQNSTPGVDVFTTGDTDFPKAFRVGECKVATPTSTDVQVLIFWRTDTRTEQREVHAEVVKNGDKWLVNKLSR